MASLRKKVLDMVDVKLNSRGERLSGSGLGRLLRFLVEAANRNVLPAVPSVWNAFVVSQVQETFKVEERNFSLLFFSSFCYDLCTHLIFTHRKVVRSLRKL